MAVVLECVETGQVFPLPLGRRVLIGRSARADIRMSVLGYNRRHCKVWWDGCRAWVGDLDSANGTYLNGYRALRCTPVRLGDILSSGVEGPRLRLATSPPVEAAWLAWEGGLIVAMARQADESGDYGGLPVLADALEEAGCTDADILNHCRQPGAHAEGCWVVDLLLLRKEKMIKTTCMKCSAPYGDLPGCPRCSREVPDGPGKAPQAVDQAGFDGAVFSEAVRLCALGQSYSASAPPASEPKTRGGPVTTPVVRIEMGVQVAKGQRSEWEPETTLRPCLEPELQPEEGRPPHEPGRNGGDGASGLWGLLTQPIGPEWEGLKGWVVSNALVIMVLCSKGVWPGMSASPKTTFLVAGSALVTIGGAGWGAYLLGGMAAEWLRGRNAKEIDRADHPRAGKVVGMVVAGVVVTALALWVVYLFMGA